jgi:hypothetical protein
MAFETVCGLIYVTEIKFYFFMGPNKTGNDEFSKLHPAELQVQRNCLALVSRMALINVVLSEVRGRQDQYFVSIHRGCAPGLVSSIRISIQRLCSWSCG